MGAIPCRIAERLREVAAFGVRLHAEEFDDGVGVHAGIE